MMGLAPLGRAVSSCAAMVTDQEGGGGDGLVEELVPLVGEGLLDPGEHPGHPDVVRAVHAVPHRDAAPQRHHHHRLPCATDSFERVWKALLLA